MKYQLPDGCTGVSHAGTTIAVAEDGTIDLIPEAAAHLLPHGITSSEEEPERSTSDEAKPAKRSTR